MDRVLRILLRLVFVVDPAGPSVSTLDTLSNVQFVYAVLSNILHGKMDSHHHHDVIMQHLPIPGVEK